MTEFPPEKKYEKTSRRNIESFLLFYVLLSVAIVGSGSNCTSAIVGSRVYGNTLATLFAHYPNVWTVERSVVGTRVLVGF